VVIKGVLHAQGKIPSPVVRLPLLPARRDTVHAAMSLLSATATSLWASAPFNSG
jgi:4-hydroxy-tetrahydrodipicolinate synthase